jgi:hypothetical protein
MSYFRYGIAPDHVPALVAVLLLPVAWWWFRRYVHNGERSAQVPETTRWAAALLLTTAVVHLALPLGHSDSPVLTTGFLASGVAFAALARRAVVGRRWRAASALLLVATLAGYLIVIARAGRTPCPACPTGEEPDQVGTATALVELAALGFCLLPVRRRWLRPLASAGLVMTTLLVGVVVWIVFATGHDEGHTGLGAHHEHASHLARAQAGIVMRPAGPPPTLEQARAAATLAARTTAAVARYRDHRVAEADGYRPTGRLAGLQVHFENKAHQRDDRLLDAEAPEMLVYAAEHGRILLLGVVYQLPTAGTPGPAIGGSTTRWHAHNVCVTLLPPGFGVVSPFGGCPYTAYALTIPEMMHLWTVDPPGGPYVDHLGDAWVRSQLAISGLPV